MTYYLVVLKNVDHVWTSHLTTGNFLKWEEHRTTGVRPPSTLFVTRASVAAILPTMKTGLQSSLEWISHSPLLHRSNGISYRPVPPCARFLYRSWGFELQYLMLAWHTGCTEHLPSPSFHSLRECRSASRVPSSQAWSSELSPRLHMNWGWWYKLRLLALRRWRIRTRSSSATSKLEGSLG